MEAIWYLNDTDSRTEEIISDENYPRRFVLNGAYDLPFGKGRRWLSGANRWLDAAICGWQFQGWFIRQSGEALGFDNTVVRGNLHDLVLPVSDRTSEQWFNLAAANLIFERNASRS